MEKEEDENDLQAMSSSSEEEKEASSSEEESEEAQDDSGSDEDFNGGDGDQEEKEETSRDPAGGKKGQSSENMEVDGDDQESQWWSAVFQGKLPEVKKMILLKDSAALTWRTKDGNGYGALHAACSNGRRRVAALLLAHPDIDVNQKDEKGRTPFWVACHEGRISCARLLLQDPRVNLGEVGSAEATPALQEIIARGYLRIAMWWIISEREMPMRGLVLDEGEIPAVACPQLVNTSLEERMKAEVISLLKRFQANAAQVRKEVQEELGARCKTCPPQVETLLGLRLKHSFRPVLDFPVIARPKLTREQYEIFLGGAPITSTGRRIFSILIFISIFQVPDSFSLSLSDIRNPVDQRMGTPRVHLRHHGTRDLSLLGRCHPPIP